MKLVIGGHAQNKLQYVTDTYQPSLILDETNWNKRTELLSKIENSQVCAVNHLHEIVKALHMENPECMDATDSIRAALLDISKVSKCLIVISDEIGNGVIPMERDARIWRESLGRLLCDLAKSADSVERVICQIPQKIK